MFTKIFLLRAAGASLAAIALLTAQPLRAQASSDTARIDKLEHAVEMLEKQNAELVRTFSAKADDSYKQILAQLRRKNADLAALSRRYQQAAAQDYFHSSLAVKVRRALLAKGEAKP